MVVVRWIDDEDENEDEEEDADDDDDDDDDDYDDDEDDDDDDDDDADNVVSFFLWWGGVKARTVTTLFPGMSDLVGGAIFSNMNLAKSQTTKSPVCSGSQPRPLC